ncbi:MAG: SCP2 sterol-binding domain-containing protein [Thermoplasmata archaeon]
MTSLEVLKEIVNKLNNNPKAKEEIKGTKDVFQFKTENQNYYLQFKEDGSAEVFEGEHPAPSVTMTAKDSDFSDIMTGKLDGVRAFFTGKLKISGNAMLANKLVGMMKKLK